MMGETPRSTYVNFFSNGFRYFFISFSFVMFSCSFATGVSATLSTLAFVFGLVLTICAGKKAFPILLTVPNLLGFLLFAWLAITIFWSQSPIAESLEALSEYRVYFMVPIFTVALMMTKTDAVHISIATMLGSLIALIASYALWLGWLEIEGAHLSLANRIFHGFIMAIFLAQALYWFLVRQNSWERAGWLALALMITFNVLGVEQGRTGYIQILGVWFVFLVFCVPRQMQLVAGLALIAGVACLVSLSESLQSVLATTASNIGHYLNGVYVPTSAGLRLNFYETGLSIFVQNFFFGVGVGDVVSALDQQFQAEFLRFKTDNVHNEYLNMGMAGGIIALVLFMSYWSHIYFVPTIKKMSERFFFFSIGLIIFISAIFNSTIKDYGEKHVLLIITPVALCFLFARGGRPKLLLER